MMDARSRKRREQYPDLAEIAETGLRRVAIHVAAGNKEHAYRAWRGVWLEIVHTYFGDSPGDSVDVVPCADIFPERLANALSACEIDCLEDFGGWTLCDLLARPNLGPASVRQINEILRAHGVFVPRGKSRSENAL